MADYFREPELEDFVRKVEKLRAEGLPTHAIMARLGVPRATLSTRLRRWRELQMKSKGDPILDVQQVCLESAKTEQEIMDAMAKLGWAANVSRMAFCAARGTYIREFSGKWAGTSVGPK